MGVDLRGRHILVPQQFLDRADVVAGFQQMCGEWQVAGVVIPAASTAQRKARCTADSCK